MTGEDDIARFDSQRYNSVLSQGGHLGRVHSDQMVLVTVRQGSWSGRAVAQRRARVSKLGLKGLSDYHLNETVIEAARRGQWAEEGATLTTCLLKKRRAGKQL